MCSSSPGSVSTWSSTTGAHFMVSTMEAARYSLTPGFMSTRRRVRLDNDSLPGRARRVRIHGEHGGSGQVLVGAAPDWMMTHYLVEHSGSVLYGEHGGSDEVLVGADLDVCQAPHQIGWWLITWSSTAGLYFMASTVAAARYSSAPLFMSTRRRARLDDDSSPGRARRVRTSWRARWQRPSTRRRQARCPPGAAPAVTRALDFPPAPVPRQP